ncbi:MAG: LCP family protein [Actinomycetota bacterium]|nr:LCP family protein [Actinomycetota bacterium]
MARGDKPYRVYRGGRARGKAPLQPSRGRILEQDGRRDGRPTKPKRRWGLGRWLAFLLFVLLAVAVTWGALGFVAVRKGVRAANARLDPEVRAVLTPQDGLLLSQPTTILLLGTDHANTDERVTFRRSDSILLVRTDPEKHRIVYLSIPRDLKAEIPGHGDAKINAAFQLGGPALAARTVKRFTGLEINHVAIVDFGSFEQLIDALGGITVDVPAPILSNRFDCPYSAERCAGWQGWRFEQGPQRMDGRRALVYSRIRENRLNPSESDVTRGERQQRVLQALASELTSPRTLARMPFVGAELLRPLATDLTAGEFAQLAWVKFRAPEERALHCRLGGSATNIGGQAYIVSTQENFAVIQMVTGRSAPQPPPPGSGPFGPGCVIGSRTIR